MGRQNAAADDEQVVLLRGALGAPKVVTRAAPSVFQLASAPKRGLAAGRAPDPRTLQVVPGRPPAAKRFCPPSAWQAVWDSIKPGGDGVVMTPEQAKNLAAWARAHGHTGKMERRTVSAVEAHVWRKK